jgi:hypothetical protein
MGDDEDLEEWNGMAKEIVSMYRAVRTEVERQRIFSLISPFTNNMFTMAMNEGLMEDFAKTSSKRKKKR